MCYIFLSETKLNNKRNLEKDSFSRLHNASHLTYSICKTNHVSAHSNPLIIDGNKFESMYSNLVRRSSELVRRFHLAPTDGRGEGKLESSLYSACCTKNGGVDNEDGAVPPAVWVCGWSG